MRTDGVATKCVSTSVSLVGLDTNSDGFVDSWSTAVTSKAGRSKDIQEFLDWAQALEAFSYDSSFLRSSSTRAT